MKRTEFCTRDLRRAFVDDTGMELDIIDRVFDNNCYTRLNFQTVGFICNCVTVVTTGNDVMTFSPAAPAEVSADEWAQEIAERISEVKIDDFTSFQDFQFAENEVLLSIVWDNKAVELAFYHK